MNSGVAIPPLCEGRQSCTLWASNDSSRACMAEYLIDTTSSWKQMGIVAPSERVEFWRPAGEHWRLVDMTTRRVVASVTTPRSGNVRLYTR